MRNDRRQGYGVQTLIAGPFIGDVYAGEWRDGKKYGLGVYRWSQDPDRGAKSLRYAGEWADSNYTGVGVYLWRDGARHAGGYRDGDRSGTGVYHWADGRRYEGEYAQNQRNGYGVEWNADGSVRRQGIWTDGTLTTPLGP